MAKRLACSACGDDPPFRERSEWRTITIRRPNGTAGGPIDEGCRLLCGECLLPLRIKWAKQSRKVA